MKKLFTLLALALSFTAISASAASIENEADYRINGSSRTVERVSANSTDVYNVTFIGGEPAEVFLVGDGDTDLDLFIYDENGNLIDSDTDNTDVCLCEWTPRWTGRFTIKIRNYGSVYNEYTMLIE